LVVVSTVTLLGGSECGSIVHFKVGSVEECCATTFVRVVLMIMDGESREVVVKSHFFFFFQE